MFTTSFVHSITTARLQPGNGMQKNYAAHLTDYRVLIQPMSAEYAAKLGMTFGRAYNMYTPLDADIKIGDKVSDQDDKEYRVSGSLKRNYGQVSHITFWLTEEAGKNLT